MTVTAAMLSQVASDLRGAAAVLRTVQQQGADLLAAAGGNLDAMPQVWHGPRPTAVLGAGEDYLLTVGGRPPQPGWVASVDAVIGVLERWAASADEYAGLLRGPEAVLADPVLTPEDGEAYNGALNAVAQHRAAWAQRCVGCASELDTYRAALSTPIGAMLFAPDFPSPPPVGSQYLAAVSQFAIVTDMPLSLIDPSGQLAAERRARLDALFGTDTGKLIFTIIETAHERDIGERDEHWSTDDLLAASDPDIVRQHIVDIYEEAGEELDDAALDLLVAETVATALALRAGNSADWEQRDQDLGFFEHGVGEWIRDDFAGPAAAFVTTAGCIAIVSAGSAGTASVPAVGGCAALGGAVGDAVHTWSNGGDLVDGLEAAVDPGRRIIDFGIGAFTQGAINRFRPAIPIAEAPQSWAATRAAELQAQLPAGSQGRVTMSAGVVRDASGSEIRVIATSEPRGYIRPGVQVNPGEVVVRGTGHAEADIVTWAAQNGYEVVTIGAGRPICPTCATTIAESGADPATVLRGGP
jgi:hypothetical protein